MKYGFGVDVGGTSVKLAFFNTEGTLLDKWEIPTVTENAGKQILPDIARSIEAYLTKHSVAREAIMGIGIGVPGPVDRKGVVNRCVNLGWGVFNVEKALYDLTGFPVKAGNDANLAALGECWMGSGRGYGDMVMVTLGTGVGGGIIIGGNVVCGAGGSAGEIGNMILCREEEEVHTSGNRGCAEQYCSATGVVRLAKRYLLSTDAPSVLRTVEPLSCKAVFDTAADGDSAAQAILEQFYTLLGEFLANICTVLDPEAVIIGGGVSKAGQVLIEGMHPHFLKNVFHASRGVQFKLAKLGKDAGTYGAFRLLNL